MRLPSLKTRMRDYSRRPAIAGASVLQTYLRDIRKIPLLTPDQEKELARRIQKGDRAARDHMVKANLRLVVNIAKNYTNRGMSLMDLVAEGNLGLMRAAEGFDPDAGTRFSTYASWWIRQSIKRGLVSKVKTIRVPAYMVEMITRFKQVSSELGDRLGREPTIEEIADAMELAPKRIFAIKRAINTFTSMDSPVGDHGGQTIADLIEDPRSAEPDSFVLDDQTKDMLYRGMSAISEREQLVLKLRYGLDEGAPMTLKEIGEVLGLTRERIRQIENESLKKLYEAMTGESAP